MLETLAEIGEAWMAVSFPLDAAEKLSIWVGLAT
jgi:hypothetical protein